MAAICTCIICHYGQQVHYFFAQGFSAEQMFPKPSMKNAWNQILLNKAVNTVGLFSQFPFHEISMGRCALFWHLFVIFKNEFLTRFSGCRGKAEASRARGCKSCWERRGFEVSFAKTSKIISIPFSITLSPCVFWSQHDSPLLLSPYNRWWRHTGGKSVLALARSNATMRKCLHFWDEVFHGAILSRRHAAIFLCAPLRLFFFHTRIAGICVRLLSLLIFCPRSFNKKKKM